MILRYQQYEPPHFPAPLASKFLLSNVAISFLPLENDSPFSRYLKKQIGKFFFQAVDFVQTIFSREAFFFFFTLLSSVFDFFSAFKVICQKHAHAHVSCESKYTSVQEWQSFFHLGPRSISPFSSPHHRLVTPYFLTPLRRQSFCNFVDKAIKTLASLISIFICTSLPSTRLVIENGISWSRKGKLAHWGIVLDIKNGDERWAARWHNIKMVTISKKAVILKVQVFLIVQVPISTVAL